MKLQIYSVLIAFELGEFVKCCLKPLVWASDYLLGSDLKHCEGCARRAAFLNSKWAAFINWLFKKN